MAGLDSLRAYGANVDEGLNRCVNNEEFYLKMIRKAVEDPGFENLQQAIAGKDLATAFEIAHALKGVLTNLALTPLAEPVSEIVELLRSKTDTDYSGYLEKIATKKDELVQLLQ
ncbi:MAG: Hpt domain-containing protein [Lachnospiraceae bacterium]|jgi:HPt (histidine-containing phosphotransfer) domain-containing protein|nr:Hpt domain-containing protein [Lachnospiraceae bacterium]